MTASQLLESLPNLPQLTYLSLAGGRILGAEAQAIANTVKKFSQLTDLRLEHTGMGPKEALEIAAKLQDLPKLEYLDLFVCPVGFEGAQAIIEAVGRLPVCSRRLNLQGNEMNQNELEELKKRLGADYPRLSVILAPFMSGGELSDSSPRRARVSGTTALLGSAAVVGTAIWLVSSGLASKFYTKDKPSSHSDCLRLNEKDIKAGGGKMLEKKLLLEKSSLTCLHLSGNELEAASLEDLVSILPRPASLDPI